MVRLNWRVGFAQGVIILLISLVNAEPPSHHGIFGNTKIATNENTKGVRYAGPIVYTNEKPPIIHFPSPPPTNGEYGHVGKGAKGNSVKYIPLPHHDLPVLIYQSDITPPLHVVGIAPRPVASPPLGDKGGYGSSYRDSYSEGSQNFHNSNYGVPSVGSTASSYRVSSSPSTITYGPPSSFGPPLKDSYGAPKGSYGLPKDTYGSPKGSYGSPKDTYGPPKGTYGPPKDTYGPPKNTYGPPNDNYGPPNDNYGPPNDNYGPPKDTYGPPENYGNGALKAYNGQSQTTYGSGKSQRHRPSKSNYGPPKSSSSYGPPKSNYGSTKSTYGRHKSSHSSTKSSYGPPKAKHVKGEYTLPSTTYTAEYIPHQSKSNSKSHKGSSPMPHIIYTGHPPIHIFQSPIYMSPPKSQKEYSPPRENDGWISSSSTKSKTTDSTEVGGSLEDSWGHSSETYLTTVPFSSSTSSAKKEKGRDKAYVGKGSSKAKGQRYHHSYSSSSSSGQKKPSSKIHSGTSKDGRQKGPHRPQGYKNPQQKGGSNIFSDMWKSVMDSAIAGSSHFANAYGYGHSSPKHHNHKSHSSQKGSSSSKYYPSAMKKPPIIIYQGIKPPVHVYEKQTHDTGLDLLGDSYSPSAYANRRNDNVDPRSRGETETLSTVDQNPVPLPTWIPANVPVSNNYQTTLYVSDLTSASGTGQVLSQQPFVGATQLPQGVQTYAIPLTQQTNESNQVMITMPIINTGETQTPMLQQQVQIIQQQEVESLQQQQQEQEQEQEQLEQEQQQQQLPTSEVSMMFKIA